MLLTSGAYSLDHSNQTCHRIMGPFLKDHFGFVITLVFNPSEWGNLNPSSYCDVGRFFFYGVFKF